MSPGRVERKLAAILAADVAGYSRLMGDDEEGTVERLKFLRHEVIDPSIGEHRGRIVKTTGDGVLVEFPSVVAAVRCAVEVQRGMADHNAAEAPETRIEFRVGINVGDIIIDGEDILGDGVNVAARLEGFAKPGGICVSGRVHENVRGKLGVAFDYAGEQRLKNIAWPVKVFTVRLGTATAAVPPTLRLPDKPSIAVLPFQNMSGDREQEYFTDGVVEEIITALSRMRWLFVTARNSSFAYKGKSPDIRQVGRELGVRYVLEGSVRKSASRLRITGQLIDASTGAHLWADRFDGGLEDVFELQDQMTSSVVGAISPKLEQAEIERAKRKPPDSLDAYDFYLRGMSSVYRWTREGVEEALRLFYKAIEIDSEFASAYGGAAWCYYWRRVNGWSTDRVRDTAEVIRLARRAAETGKEDAVALTFSGLAMGWVGDDVEAAAQLTTRALALNPNLAAAWCASGFLTATFGDPEVAIEHMGHAMRLSPLDPVMFFMQTFTAFAHFLVGRYDEARVLAERACREQPYFSSAMRMAAACNASAGRLDEARQFIARLLVLDPTLRLSTLKDRVTALPADRFAKYLEALRAAGLPE